jgi:hypothetical protein
MEKGRQSVVSELSQAKDQIACLETSLKEKAMKLEQLKLEKDREVRNFFIDTDLDRHFSINNRRSQNSNHNLERTYNQNPEQPPNNPRTSIRRNKSQSL